MEKYLNVVRPDIGWARVSIACMLCILLIGVFLSQPPTCLNAQEPDLTWRDLSPADRWKSLDFVTTQIETNFSNIRTWSGKYEITTRDILDVTRMIENKVLPASVGPVLDTESKAVVDFHVNLETNEIYSDFQSLTKPLKLDAAGMILYETPSRKTIQTNEHSVSIHPDRIGGTRGDDPTVPGWEREKSRVLDRETSERADDNKIFGTVFDPRLLFADGPQLFKDEFRRLLESTRKQRKLTEVQMRVAESGSRVLYQLTSDLKGQVPGRGYRRAVTFDSQAGFNVVAVSWTATPSYQPFKQITCRYQRNSGIYIPNRHVSRQYIYDTGQLRVGRTVSLVEARLNQQIPEQVFSVKQLGVDDGDRMIDHLRNEVLVRRHDQWLTPKEYLDQHEANVARRRWRTLFALAGGLVGLLVLFAAAQRWGRGRKA